MGKNAKLTSYLVLYLFLGLCKNETASFRNDEILNHSHKLNFFMPPFL